MKRANQIAFVVEVNAMLIALAKTLEREKSHADFMGNAQDMSFFFVSRLAERNEHVGGI